MFTDERYQEAAKREVEIKDFKPEEVKAFLESLLPDDQRYPPNREFSSSA